MRGRACGGRRNGRAAKVAGVALAGLATSVGAVGAQDVEIGGRAGVSSSTVAWSESPLGGGFERLERRSAGGGALFLTVPGPGPLRLRIEVAEARRGFREVDGDGDRTLLDVDYLEVPVLLGWRVQTGGPIEPEIYGGGWLAFEHRCRAGIESGSTALDFDCDEVPEDDVLRHTRDWGLAAGVALRFDLGGPLRGLIDARWSAGLRNVDAAEPVDNLDIRHRTLTLSAGVALALGS